MNSSNTSPVQHMSTSQPVVKKRRLPKSIIVGASVIALSTAGAGYYIWSQQPIIDRNVIKDARFSVYAPTATPKGYALNDDETRLGGGTLTYSFSDVDDESKITVTVQPKPSGFDMRQMTKDGSINTTATTNGTLYNLSAGGMSKHLLDTGESLVFLTSPVEIDSATVAAFASSLKKLN